MPCDSERGLPPRSNVTESAGQDQQRRISFISSDKRRFCRNVSVGSSRHMQPAKIAGASACSLVGGMEGPLRGCCYQMLHALPILCDAPLRLAVPVRLPIQSLPLSKSTHRPQSPLGPPDPRLRQRDSLRRTGDHGHASARRVLIVGRHRQAPLSHRRQNITVRVRYRN